MARQSLLPGVGWINETKLRQALLPAGAWINDTASTATTGTIASTQAADTMAASALETIKGTVASTQAADTMAASALEKMTGTLAPVEAADTMSATGTLIAPVSATGAMLQAAHTMAAVGLFAVSSLRDNTSTIFRAIKKRKPVILDLHAAQEKHSAALKAAVSELFFPKSVLPSIPDSYDPIETVASVFATAMKPAETPEPDVIVPPEHHEFELLLLLA